MEPQLDEMLGLLVGQFVWAVKRGHGTFLTMEFGKPHLVVREPSASTSQNPQVSKLLARRMVGVIGDMSLWVRDAQWAILTKAQQLI
jgi:hypothetical protein